MFMVDFQNRDSSRRVSRSIAIGRAAGQGDHRRGRQPRIHYPGDYNIAVRGQRDIDYRGRVLIEHGIEHSTDDVDHVRHPRGDAADRARSPPSSTMRLRGSWPPGLDGSPRWRRCRSTYRGFGERTDRASRQGFSAMLFSNVNGVALADKCFSPLNRARERDGHGVLHSSGASASVSRP